MLKVNLLRQPYETFYRAGIESLSYKIPTVSIVTQLGLSGYEVMVVQREPLVVGSAKVNSRSILSAIEKMMSVDPDKIALETPLEKLSYAELHASSCSLARDWRDNRGCASGSVIALSSCNTGVFLIVLVACRMLGARLVLIPPSLEHDVFVHAIKQSCPDVLVAQGEAHRLMGVACGIGYVVAIDEVTHAIVGDDMLSLCYQESLNCFEAESEDDKAEIVLFSSGTTGVPKTIVCAFSAFERNASLLKKVLDLKGDDVLFLPVPFFHAFGIVGQCAALLAGAHLTTLEHYRPDMALSFLERTRSTVHFGVPTMFVRELKVASSCDVDLSFLRTGLVAGASCPRSVLAEFEGRWGCRLVQSYGMSETAATLTVGFPNWPLETRIRYVGAPVEGVRIEVDPCSSEIICKSQSMMKGELRQGILVSPNLNAQGWFSTGDLGYIENGLLIILGRSKDVIIRGGVNIYPKEVERVYDSCPSISACCLVSYPDSELGERTCLCVVLAKGVDVTPIKLRGFAYGRIEKCKIPDKIVALDEFPRLSSGKIDQDRLRSLVKRVATQGQVPENKEEKSR